jgi:peptide/nickel transport system substrate-binding protein
MMKKQRVTKKQMAQIHPYIPEAHHQFTQGRMTRREFLRLATLLGLSAAAAACVVPAEQVQQEDQPTGAIKRGGSWKCGMELSGIDHPARATWAPQANVIRQVAEYLTETGGDNVTRPHLLEKWEASEDVKTWTLYLRKGITFNNGQELTTKDVMFSFEQWLDEEIGSSMKGMLAYLGGMQNVEQVDDYTIRLHLEEGNIAVPEHLFHTPAVILPHTFEGDFIKQPVGTGPFLLKEFAEGERAAFVRREDYWKMGADGKPLPYLDEVIYISMDKDAAVAAMQSGQIDTMFQPRPSDWLAMQDVDGITVYPVGTAQTLVIRMRADVEPWNDVRVRNALKMCIDREKMLQLSYYGEGELGHDAHVAPVHPAYCEKPIPAYDPEGAKALLAEAGYPDGLRVTLASKNDLAEPEMAQALKEMAAPAGFDITLDLTDPPGYWDRWTEVDFGITPWTHRPLDTQVLRLAYTADEEGNPVAWNETHWIDQEFSDLLTEAERTLDVEARRAIMCQIEDIMMERGSVAIPYWKDVWTIIRSEFRDVVVHPADPDILYDTWKDA